MDRRTAVELVTEARAGSHHCLFYQSQDDLVDVLAGYFKSGIEKGESCIWVTADGGVEQKARDAISRKLSGRDARQAASNIEFVRCSDWYLRDGSFHPEQVLNRWVERLKLAADRGYKGLRVSGDLGWLDATDWRTLMGYEKDVNSLIAGKDFEAVCSYPLAKINASQMIDVIGYHQVALGRNNGEWHSLKALPPDVAPVDGTIHAALAEKQAAGDQISEYPVLFPENCNGCGVCITVCSSGSLFLSNGRIALKPVGPCDWCAYCEAVCLSNAIFCPFEISAVES